MVNEKIGTSENVVTTLIPPGDEIHACGACGGEINIEKDSNIVVIDNGYGKCAYHKDCEIGETKLNRSTLIRLE